MKRKSVFYLFLLACFLQVSAQKTGLQSFSMKHGENYTYDVQYKWGLFMTTAGEAAFTYKQDNSISGAVSKLNVNYKSVGIFDGIFKMRDTLTGYYNERNMLIYSYQSTNDGSYKAIEKYNFKYESNKTFVHSWRYRPTRDTVTVDTTLTAVGMVSDMLSVFHFLRGINRNMLQSGDLFPITVAVGKDLVKVQLVYQNQSIVDRGSVKYNTRHFLIDIFDDAFENKKAAAEVWVGDDDNFLPIKLRTKLKIGYIEIYYKSSAGLAHPFNSRIENKK